MRALNIQKNIVEDSNSFSLRFSRNLPTNVKEDAEILSMIGLTVDTMTEEALTDVLSKVTIIEDPNRVAIGIKGSIQ